jgi:RNA polymerase sigma factor (sigma-70 family)
MDTKMRADPQVHAALRSNIEVMLAEARPRLLRLAQLQGVAPEAADDIAQETLLQAWRSLDHLRAPDRFDAWLDGICRNMCRRWARAQSAAPSALPLSAPWPGGASTEAPPELELPDPQAPDPAEALERQDLELLLDRALGHLPASARQIIELCYLAEVPQREAALRLGLTIGALELRLHRARKQLRDLLSSDLRADAEAFDLLPGTEPSTGWRESRLWCSQCGRQRLRGIFEPMPDGRVNLRLRCPACSPNFDVDMTDSGGLVELNGLRSFLPALKRIDQTTTPRYLQALAGERVRCLQCQEPMQVCILHADEMEVRFPPGQFYARLRCPLHGTSNISVKLAARWSHPVIETFMERHPRWVGEPDILTEYAGQPALRLCLADITSASRLTIFAHYPTLRVLATFET